MLALFSLTNDIFKKELEFENNLSFSSFLLYEIMDSLVSWLDYFPEINIFDKIYQILESNVIVAKFIERESSLIKNCYSEFNKVIHKIINKKIKNENTFRYNELKTLNDEFKNYKISQLNDFEKLRDILDTKELDAIREVISESTLKDFLPSRASIESKFLKRVLEWSEKKYSNNFLFIKYKILDVSTR